MEKVLFILAYLFAACPLHAMEQPSQAVISPKSKLQKLEIIGNLGSLAPLLTKGDLLLLDIDHTVLARQGDAVTSLDPDIKDIVQSLENRGVAVLFLTARKNPQETEQHLTELGILPSTTFENVDMSNFQKGVLYAPNEKPSKASTKGRVLKSFFENVATTFNKVVFVDDLQTNLDAFKAEFPEENYYAIRIDANQVVFRTQPEFPDNLLNMQYVEYLQGGGGGVYVLQDESNKKWVLKCSGSDVNHFKEELAADVLTAASGAPAPAIAVYRTRPNLRELQGCQGPFYRLTNYLEPIPADQETIEQSYRNRFIVDSFLSNWDVGYGKNTIFTKQGLVSIDHGGALRYRSVGEKKTHANSWDPYTVTELITFPLNFDQYKGITGNDVVPQIQSLLEHYPIMMKELARLNSVIPLENYSTLAHMLASRLAFLKIKLPQFEINRDKTVPEALRPDLAIPGETAAGTFIYTYINGAPYVLLGKRIRHEWYGNLGGKSDPEDIYLLVTAARETTEESIHALKLISGDLLSNAYIDSQGTPRFRTYFHEVSNKNGGGVSVG